MTSSSKALYSQQSSFKEYLCLYDRKLSRPLHTASSHKCQSDKDKTLVYSDTETGLAIWDKTTSCV